MKKMDGEIIGRNLSGFLLGVIGKVLMVSQLKYRLETELRSAGRPVTLGMGSLGVTPQIAHDFFKGLTVPGAIAMTPLAYP